MANVEGASLGPIFSRLNSVPEYHPLDADTFADWSVEAGDIVTVTRDGNNYASPVHQASMSWKRGQQVQLSATGKKERDPLTKLSQQKFNRGGGGMRRQDYWHQYVTDMYGNIRSGIELTESHARLYAQNAENTMRSELKLTESSAHLYSENLYSQMRSGLKLTESSAHLYTESLYRQLRSGIELAADSASMYVRSKTTRAAICLAINGNGGSSTLIQSDHVQVTGGITVRDIMDITASGYVGFKRGVQVSNSAGGSGGCTMWPDGLFQGSSLMLASKGSSGYAVNTINAEQLGKVFIDLKVSGAKGTFTRLNGETVDFNKAVTGFALGAGSGKINVTALPRGMGSISIPVSIDGPGRLTSTGTYTYKIYFENQDGDDVFVPGATKSVTVDMGTASVSSIEIENYAISVSPPTGYDGAVELTKLSNYIRNNRNTHIWFKANAYSSNKTLLYSKNYYIASL